MVGAEVSEDKRGNEGGADGDAAGMRSRPLEKLAEATNQHRLARQL